MNKTSLKISNFLTVALLLFNTAGEEWGWPRFLETVVECADRGARDVVENVLETAEEFAAGAPRQDDVTLWAARVQKVAANEPHWFSQCIAEPVAA